MLQTPTYRKSVSKEHKACSTEKNMKAYKTREDKPGLEKRRIKRDLKSTLQRVFRVKSLKVHQKKKPTRDSERQFDNRSVKEAPEIAKAENSVTDLHW